MILPKENIYPILLPPKYFIDIFQKQNAFFNMNPSMYIERDGSVKILVRRIDYRKFQNKQFTMYNQYSNSHYSLMSGKILPGKKLDLDSFLVEDIQYDYGLPIYNTYWKGLEDIRFISSSRLLACIPECNPNGNPSIFQATLEGNKIHSVSSCSPNTIEKNWMPFSIEHIKNLVIYSLSPFQIKSVEENDLQEIPLPESTRKDLEGYNGSTNGIYYKEGYYLFLIHANKERTYHRWLLFHRLLPHVVVSKPFTFFNHSYIEFPISLCEFENRCFVSLGINDDSAYILEISYSVIESTFQAL